MHSATKLVRSLATASTSSSPLPPLFLTPAARQLVLQHHLDAKTIPFKSNRSNRLSKTDVLLFLQRGRPDTLVTNVVAATTTAKSTSTTAKRAPSPAETGSGQPQLKGVSSRMQRIYDNVPFTQAPALTDFEAQSLSVVVECDVTKFQQLQSKFKDLTLEIVASQAARRASEAVPNVVNPKELSIVNLGIYGIRSFTGVVMNDENHTCTIGIGAVQAVPGGKQIATFTLSSNTVDNQQAAEWMQHFKAVVENPTTGI